MIPFDNTLIDYEQWFEDDTFREMAIPVDSKFVYFYITLKSAPLYVNNSILLATRANTILLRFDESFDGCKSDRTEHLEELRVAGYRYASIHLVKSESLWLTKKQNQC